LGRRSSFSFNSAHRMRTLDLGQTAAPSSSRFERVDLNVHGDNPPFDPIPGQRPRVMRLLNNEENYSE
jgi:hypothetical protein